MKFVYVIMVFLLFELCYGDGKEKTFLVKNSKNHKIHVSDDAFYGVIVFEKNGYAAAFHSRKASFRMMYGSDVHKHKSTISEFTITEKQLKDLVAIPFLSPDKSTMHGRSVEKSEHYLTNIKDYRVSIYYLVFDKNNPQRISFSFILKHDQSVKK